MRLCASDALLISSCSCNDSVSSLITLGKFAAALPRMSCRSASMPSKACCTALASARGFAAWTSASVAGRCRIGASMPRVRSALFSCRIKVSTLPFMKMSFFTSIAAGQAVTTVESLRDRRW